MNRALGRQAPVISTVETSSDSGLLETGDVLLIESFAYQSECVLESYK